MTDTPLPSPAAVIAFLDESAAELDSLGKRLEGAHIQLGDAEATWDQAKDIAMLEIVEEYEADPNRRLPGEDVRLALARKRTGFQPYADWVKAKRLVTGLERRAKRMETAVEARRSTLKRLDGGMALEGYGKPGESRPALPEDSQGEWQTA